MTSCTLITLISRFVRGHNNYKRNAKVLYSRYIYVAWLYVLEYKMN